MDDLKRKKAVGSGNMSTPATTSSNASSSGYGYAPMFEALGILGSGASSGDDMANAVSANSGTAGTPNRYTSPTDTTGMTNAEIRAAAERAATANPFSVVGVDLGAAGIGMGVSNLIGGAIGGPVGLLLGALGSWGAKKLYNEELRNQQTENFFKIISQTDIDADMEGRAGSGIAPINEDDPHNVWIKNNVVITGADREAEEAASNNSSSTSGSSNPAGSSTVTPGSWNNYYGTTQNSSSSSTSTPGSWNNYAGTTGESSTSYSTPGSWGSSGTW